MIDNVVVLIPSYDPDDKLVRVVKDLMLKFRDILVINDGSSKGLSEFACLQELGVRVVSHQNNRGKGAAIKTGLKWVWEREDKYVGAVTADSDGQHSPDDIERVAQELINHPNQVVLGVRQFSGNVPFRSRLGNSATSILFRILSGVTVQDTQTGLRGIPKNMIPRMLSIPGERYEYEMRMLYDCKFHPLKPVQVEISTIYIEGNKSSHFRPIHDSLRIWSALLKSVAMGNG